MLAIRNDIIKTANGDYAVLYWKKDINKKIQIALNQDEPLASRFDIGITTTPYGTLVWLLVAVDREEDFCHNADNLFWFNFIINPGTKNSLDQQWLKILRHQSQLDLVILHDNNLHFCCIVKQPRLAQYVMAVEKCISSWKKNNNYQQAVTYVQSNIIRKIQRNAIENLKTKYSNSDAEHLLVLRFIQEAHELLPPKLYQLLKASGPMGEELQMWRQKVTGQLSQRSISLMLASSSHNLVENLARNWLFAQMCLEHSKEQQRGNNELQIAVGVSDSGKWTWMNLPHISTSPVMLYSLSEVYRHLLNRNWKPVLQSNDAVIASIDLPLIGYIGKVPNRPAFNSVSKILQDAVLSRQFGFVQPTAILIGKIGLEEIEYWPLGEAGLKCLFKITLLKSSSSPNSVLLGQIDALKGTIEAIGTAPSAAVKLLLFLAAIAYRDILVARDVVAVAPTAYNRSGKLEKIRAKDRKKQVKLVARIKYTKAQIDSSFADPHKVAASLKRFHSYLRSCHLRRLRDGWSASQRQVCLAQEYQYLLPEGYTFVRPASVTGTSDRALRDEFKSISLMNILFDVREDSAMQD